MTIRIDVGYVGIVCQLLKVCPRDGIVIRPDQIECTVEARSMTQGQFVVGTASRLASELDNYIDTIC